MFFEYYVIGRQECLNQNIMKGEKLGYDKIHTLLCSEFKSHDKATFLFEFYLLWKLYAKVYRSWIAF